MVRLRCRGRPALRYSDQVLKRAVWSAVLSVALAAAAGGQRSFAQERWYQAYTEGLNAFQKAQSVSAEAARKATAPSAAEQAALKAQWTLAEQKFKAALAGNPQQGRRVFFYGTRRDDYLPEYYLAQIYLQTGRDAEAAPLLNRIEKSGFIKKGDREFGEFSRLSTQARLAVAPNASATATPANAGAQTAQQGSPATPNGTPAAGGGLDSKPANTNASNATATPSPGATPPPAAAAPNANPPTAANAAGAGVNAPAGAGAGPTAVPSPPPLVRTPPPAARDVRRQPVSPVIPPAATIADLERRALSAFYRGDYPAAMSLLESGDYQRLATSDLSRRKRLFYLACSSAAVALTQAGAVDRLAQARAQFGEAQGDGPQFAADRRYISPRVLNALASARR
jgi:hypothetical protein